MYVNKMDKNSPICQVSPDESKRESVQKKNQLLASFLGYPDYYAAYRLAMEDPTTENLERLDRFFKEFYFDIRFTSYISMPSTSINANVYRIPATVLRSMPLFLRGTAALLQRCWAMLNHLSPWMRY